MTVSSSQTRAMSFVEGLQTQRWDDHRFYHHCRINQSLHFISALSFLTAYVFLFIDPVVSAFLGWGVSMVTRQSGHFFFEPRGYDAINQATHEHKEAIKVGYNLSRKYVLMAAWLATTFVPYFSPTLFGIYAPYASGYEYAHHVAVLWIATGVVAILLRALWLTIHVSPRSGLVWTTKILTDPFHDAKIYWKSPLHLLRGQRYDPMTDWPAPGTRV